MLKTENDQTKLSLKCAACCSKRSIILKEQEAKQILSSLGLKTSLNKIISLGKIFFNNTYQYKMNKIVNTFLLVGEKFIHEMHLKKQNLLIVLLVHLIHFQE